MSRKAALLAIGAALAAQAGFAQSILEFDVWMQKIDLRSQSILRNLARKDIDASLADARELGRLYQQMEVFYEKTGDADDAVLASYLGKELAAEAATAIGRQDFDAAAVAAGDIARDCRNCHVRYTGRFRGARP